MKENTSEIIRQLLDSPSLIAECMKDKDATIEKLLDWEYLINEHINHILTEDMNSKVTFSQTSVQVPSSVNCKITEKCNIIKKQIEEISNALHNNKIVINP